MEMIENITLNENLVFWGMLNASMGPNYSRTSSNDIPFSNAEEENFENFPFYDDTPLVDFPQNISTFANLSEASSSNSTPSAPSSASPSSSSSSAASGSIYETFMDESRHWVQKVLVPLVMCVGVVGNSVSMVVLTRRKMRSSTNSYLTALAISDLLYLIFVFFLSLKHHPDMQHPRHWLYWQYVRYALWLTDASSSTSIWLTVTFTIERYVVVSHPIKGKVLCTVSRAKKFVVVVYCVCWLLTATTPHEWIVVTKTRYPLQDPRLDLDYSALGRDPTYRHFYYWFTAVTFILLPLCLLVVFNGFLMQAVRR
ncbi:FMRFamide receptor-like [Macrobrachium rosenbergii]|uniref:FMRFamide receptor-like n=1 Tax=Macrobrachium rosenbergii TaxID=79674 RepID=UPI0034D6CA87